MLAHALNISAWTYKESISIALRNSVGKIVMECVIETKASTILQFIDGLRGDVRVTFEGGTWANWLYDSRKSWCVIREKTSHGNKGYR